MTFGCFRNMMDFLRNQVRNYCRGELPTLDEAESLAVVLGEMAYNTFGGERDNKEQFEMAVQRFVRNEILRVCA